MAIGTGLPRGPEPAAAADPARAMRFPVDANVRFSDDFGARRSGGRRHQGNDLMGAKLDRLVAAADGTVTMARSGGMPGNMLAITDAEGWQYWYMHLNNDNSGTDDGRAPRDLVFGPGIAVGARVTAGQLVGFLGDSGNAEHTAPHLHFELHAPGGRVIDPYASLVAAQQAGGVPAAAPPVAFPLGAQQLAQPVARATARAAAANPRGGYYVLAGDGTVRAYDGAPDHGSPRLPKDLARAIAVAPDGAGYVVLDAWGGLHRFGSARDGALGALAGPYWPGEDRARALAITPTGRGYVVLDADGGVHSSGDAPASPGVDLPPGLARDVALSPSGRGVYVLDAWGGVHASGDDAVARPGPYWPGQNLAQRIVVTPSGQGYAVLDAWGGLHPTGDAPRPSAGTYEPGGDWRAVALASDSYVALRSDGFAERRPTEPPAAAPPAGGGEAAPAAAATDTAAAAAAPEVR